MSMKGCQRAWDMMEEPTVDEEEQEVEEIEKKVSVHVTKSVIESRKEKGAFKAEGWSRFCGDNNEIGYFEIEAYGKTEIDALQELSISMRQSWEKIEKQLSMQIEKERENTND